MLFVGVVEDRNDPLQLGRVKVRVYGLHTDNKTQIPTEDLPWAQVVQPTTSSANSGIGETPAMVEGSTVICMFVDMNDMQQPIVIGTLAGNIQEHYKRVNNEPVTRDKEMGFNDPSGKYPKKEYIGESDLNKLARDDAETPHTIIDTRDSERVNKVDTGQGSWDEPTSGVGKHKYPFNKVTETESGHLIEIDDTEGNERIHISHKNGTFIEIHNDAIVHKVKGSKFEIVSKNNNVYILGDANLTIDSNCNTYIKGDYNLKVDGRINQVSRGNHTIIAPKIDLNP